MTNKKRSLTARIYRAYSAFLEPLHRVTLPLSHSLGKVKPAQTCSITARAHSVGVWPDRLTISNAGTSGGASDWIVNDIKIENVSQFIQSGDIPGDMFETNAVSSFVNFKGVKAGMTVEIIVTYIGLNEEGCPFIAAITGMEYDPGLLEILRESIAAALTSAARGVGTRAR